MKLEDTFLSFPTLTHWGDLVLLVYGIQWENLVPLVYGRETGANFNFNTWLVRHFSTLCASFVLE